MYPPTRVLWYILKKGTLKAKIPPNPRVSGWAHDIFKYNSIDQKSTDSQHPQTTWTDDKEHRHMMLNAKGRSAPPIHILFSQSIQMTSLYKGHMTLATPYRYLSDFCVKSDVVTVADNV